MHTMADEIALAQTGRQAAIIRGILEPGHIWDKLPVKTVKTLEVKNRRWLSIPTVGFRLPNEAFTEGTGKTELIAYGLAIIGHDIDIDRVYDEETDHIIKPSQLYTEMTLKAISYKLNNTLFNGDKTADPRSFDGLKVISKDMPSRQLVDASLAKYGGDGTQLNLSSGGASSTVRQGFLDALNRAKFVTGNDIGTPDLMVMNENMYWMVESILRRETLLANDKDKFDRVINTYRGVPFVDAGYLDIDGNTLCIANDHDNPGGSPARTSIYFLKLDAERELGVLQTKSIQVRSMGELQAKPVNRYRIDWTCGVPVWGKHSFARLQNLQIQ